MRDYVLLKDDLDALIDGYDTNPLITENQRKIWHKCGKRAAITHANLGYDGKDNENPLRLLKEDGFDDLPVGSLLGRSAQSYWDYGINHVFPAQRDLVRIALFFHLDVYRISLMALKGEWEAFFKKEIKVISKQCDKTRGEDLIDILKYSTDYERKKALSRFNPDTQSLFDLLEHHGRLATGAGYTVENFDSMIQNMLSKELHWEANDSKAVILFIQDETACIRILREGSTVEKEAFWIARMSWNQKLSDLDTLLLSIENMRLQHREIERQWLVIFGSLEISLQEVIIRYGNLHRRLLLLKANPSMRPEELEEQVRQTEEQEKNRLNNLKKMTLLAKIQERSSVGSGTAMDTQMIDEFQKKCRGLIRQIQHLIHPDRLEQDPAYSALTESQKKELQQFLLASFEPDNDELGVPKGFYNADMRTPQGLARVLSRIREILDNAGIDITGDTSIKGETLKEQLAWLQQEMTRLDKAFNAAMLTLQAMASREDIKIKKNNVDNTEGHEKIKTDLGEQIEGYRVKVGALEAELAILCRRNS